MNEKAKYIGVAKIPKNEGWELANILPIPQREMDTNKALVQNEEY